MARWVEFSPLGNERLQRLRPCRVLPPPAQTCKPRFQKVVRPASLPRGSATGPRGRQTTEGSGSRVQEVDNRQYLLKVDAPPGSTATRTVAPPTRPQSQSNPNTAAGDTLSR